MVWPFLTNSHVVELREKLTAAEGTVAHLRTLLASARTAAAVCEAKRVRAAEIYSRIRDEEKRIQLVQLGRIAELETLQAHVAFVEGELEELKQAAASNAVSADNDRLAREVSALRLEKEGLQRRWDNHTAVCLVAAAVHDHDDDKAKENGS